MTRVKRTVLIAVALLATFVAALPAAAEDGASTKGVVVSLTASAVSVKDAKGVVTTCALAAKSPSLAGYAEGDRVQVQCRHAKRGLVLAKVRHLAANTVPPRTDDAKPVTFGGAITALSDGSISLHDGNRDLTCTIDSSSPSTADFHVGQHVKAACTGGVLSAIAALPAPPTSTDPKPGDPPRKTTGAQGTLTALTTSSVTVHTDGGDVTCTVGPSSAGVAHVQVGDRVKMGCVNGALVEIEQVDAGSTPPPPPPAPSPVVTFAGMLAALSDSSLTVHNLEHGDLTCSLGPSSPRLGDYHLGDRVGIACSGGVLVKITKLS